MAGQQQQNADDSLGTLWIIAAVFAGGLILWYVEHAWIVTFIFKIREAEIAFLSLFTDSLSQVKNFMVQSNPAKVNFTQIIQVSTAVGKVLVIPILVLFSALCVVLYRSSANSRYRKTYSMQTLAEQEKNNWPYITPILHLDLLSEPIDKGPWAMAMTPMQFAKKYKLLIETRQNTGPSGLKKDIKTLVTVQRSKANRLFARQLGQPWIDVWQLKPYVRALVAIFIARAEADRAPATKLLKQISASATGKHLNLSGADALLKKHESGKVFKRITQAHAYELTVMASCLEVARMDGVLATAEFLWLKPIDRTLWYVLNTVGRQTAPVEVAGIMAHWLAEKTIGRALTVPMIEEASIALDAAIEELIYKPDEAA